MFLNLKLKKNFFQKNPNILTLKKIYFFKNRPKFYNFLI